MATLTGRISTLPLASQLTAVSGYSPPHSPCLKQPCLLYPAVPFQLFYMAPQVTFVLKLFFVGFLRYQTFLHSFLPLTFFSVFLAGSSSSAHLSDTSVPVPGLLHCLGNLVCSCCSLAFMANYSQNFISKIFFQSPRLPAHRHLR